MAALLRVSEPSEVEVPEGKDGRVDDLKERRGPASAQAEVAAEAERRISQERLLFSFYHDEVTGLPNRTYWRELVRMYLEASKDRAEAVGFSVMCVDLDNFKDVNDDLGYSAGDAVLVEAAARLRACLRSHDVIGRLGGDEFAVLLPDLRDSAEIRLVANRLLEKLRAPFTVPERSFDLGGSIGIALYPEHGGTVEELLQHADVALHSAKRDGRNCHRVYVPEMADANDQRRGMKQAILRALAGDEFALYYQPLLDLRTGRCDGAEALIRWNDPQKGLVMPGHFIALAEETDLMPGIGRWTYEAAAKQIRAWNLVGRRVQVSLNASVKQLQDPDFFAHLYDTLRFNNVSPDQVKLEVTESVALDDVGMAKEILTRARRIGVRTVLDDFGTDYSSLTYLQKLPIDEIKIDMSFVRNLPDSEHDAAIVRGVIALGHDLNRTIVAEGVETVEQLEWLRKANCDIIQGYLVERPMPAHKFERWRDVQMPYALST